MAKLDPQVLDHLEWLGFVQPTGLVVSAPALVRAGAILDRRDAEGQRLLQACVESRPAPGKSDPIDVVPDFESFARQVLGWSFSPKGYAGTTDEPIPDELEVALPDYDEVLHPDFAVMEPDPDDEGPKWQLLVRTLDPGAGFDEIVRSGGHLEASPTSRMERLLRETQVSAGLLFNGHALRLISAPRGESSGWVDFKVADMVQTAGRPICTAMRLLLNEQRLLAMGRDQRLPALLTESRKFQNEVSEKLAEQVLHALYEFLRGFQVAHDASGGDLLREPLADDPDEVYRALLTVILRLVFLLYAEERDMLPDHDTYNQHYSLAGLFERLRDDAALHPDTMDQRFGAWAQLLVLFRVVFDGAPSWGLPQRHGVLFDPDRFPFLEGRPAAGTRQKGERIQAPLVPDGTIYRVLEDLLILDGERISYRALDVEQIGSVYETMMGFRLETATGTSIAIKAQKRHGAPTAVDLEQLAAEAPKKRAKWIQDRADRKLTAKVGKAVSEASSLADLHAALQPVADKAATPDLVPRGAMVLQPSQERRRSGSHYTPRSLTEPIVRTTLEPIFDRLRSEAGGIPTPEQILDLKVCDPAMGSGAFLVESCRQLGDALVDSWRAHDTMPEIPPDEDEVIFARRLIAQRCLYGVDRNPVAVDLAKVSLWLATLAKDHALTFLDHALRHGDSLVGLSKKQIESLHWDEGAPPTVASEKVEARLDKYAALRQEIREAKDSLSEWELRDRWDAAEAELDAIRIYGDLVVGAFFAADKPKARDDVRVAHAQAVLDGREDRYRGELREKRSSDPPLAPFHWEIEFPEVFDRENPGFDAIVGNPPFAGKNSAASANAPGYSDWLKHIHEESHGNADLVAHFFRRAFDRLRHGGALGLIATNTIGQGDTRASGLRWICTHGGEIFAARKRAKWPGLAAVVVSVLHVSKGTFAGSKRIDEREVDTITAFLFHRGGHDDPVRLVANAGKSFQGSIVLGMGFTFDDTDNKGVATPLAEMRRLIAKDPKNQAVIFPYIGYAEVASSPVHAHHRYVINFGERSEEECRARWPDLMAIVEAKVKPERAKLTKNAIGRKRAKFWWQYGSLAKELQAAIGGLERVLVAGSQASTQYALAFLPAGIVYSSNLSVMSTESYAGFATLQCRVHEIWARFFMSTLKDDLAYTPTTCFEPFPFPEGWETHPALEAAGRPYYEFRAELMVENDEGLTKTYNRFHDPEERDPDILKLRELHASMDRAVLDAYGWDDVPTDCEFLLDYEESEEEGRKKKPWRYRWPDEVRDDVLARLLQLNAERASGEGRAGKASMATKSTRARRSKRTDSRRQNGSLFD